MQNQRVKKTIILAIVTLQLILLSSCISNSSGNSEELGFTILLQEHKGNTIENLRNFGFVANDNHYIYYLTFNRQGSTLSRRSIADSESRIIGAGRISYLNVVDGFIYHVNDANSKIYRMDINGEQHERLSDIQVSFLFVLNDTVYALSHYFLEGNRDFIAMNLDGLDVRILSDNSVRSVYFYDDKIYYRVFMDGRTSFYRMDLNGENKKLVFQRTTGSIGTNFFVRKGNVYYVEAHRFIKRFDISTQEHVTVHYTGGPTTHINRKDNILFYSSRTAAPFPLRAHAWINLDTGETGFASGVDAAYHHVIGDRIFFYDGNDSSKIYTMNIDGSDVRRFN